MASILLANLCHGLLEGGVGDQVLLDLLIGLIGVLHSLTLARIEMLGDLGGLVHVRLQICWLGQFEHISVEGRHLRPDVIEEISLLHVVPLDSDGDLLKDVCLGEVELQETDLVNIHLDAAMVLIERFEGSR